MLCYVLLYIILYCIVLCYSIVYFYYVILYLHQVYRVNIKTSHWYTAKYNIIAILYTLPVERLKIICFHVGELLLRTSELDKLLYHTVMNLGQEMENEEAQSKTSTKPFPWYNYLQKERASQYQTLIEFVQKLQSGRIEF